MTDQPMPTNNNVSEEENVSEAVLRSYLRKIEKAQQTGNATEHTYRAALQELLEALFSDITVTNEPKRIKCGAPVIKGTRIPIERILFLLKDGYNLEAIHLEYPQVDIKTLEKVIDELSQIVNTHLHGPSLS